MQEKIWISALNGIIKPAIPICTLNHIIKKKDMRSSNINFIISKPKLSSIDLQSYMPSVLIATFLICDNNSLESSLETQEKRDWRISIPLSRILVFWLETRRRAFWRTTWEDWSCNGRPDYTSKESIKITWLLNWERRVVNKSVRINKEWPGVEGEITSNNMLQQSVNFLPARMHFSISFYKWYVLSILTEQFVLSAISTKSKTVVFPKRLHFFITALTAMVIREHKRVNETQTSWR